MSELLKNAAELEKQSPQNDVPEWLAKMQKQFEETGSYTCDDVFRLLGDPRESVEMGVDEETELAIPV